MRAALSLSLCALILALTACGDASGDELSRPDERAGTSDVLARGEATAAEQTAAARAAVEAHPVATVVVLGDSISAGLHLDEDEAFPALVAARLAADGLPVRMINAGVSGDTSAGGLRRVDWLLKQRPHVLVVELGGNDGLRGQPVTEISANLSGIVERARAAGATPLLLGMALPASMGPDYVAEFRDAYASLAERFELAFVPGFMDDVGGRPALNLADGLHPNAAGHALLADKLYPELRRVVAEVSGLD
ncbi:MAG: hypothetical protein DHS20C15_33530 [Planctomycetota bacterium]|nr:MAG: hypothetical protein DHS20C15_33530 [Planctomycetota bacterium]